MSRNQALTSFSQDLYVSHNQIFTYLNCSLKYRFHYVEKRKPERISIALAFRQSHARGSGAVLPVPERRPQQGALNALHEKFEEVLRNHWKRTPAHQSIWKKNMPDQAGAIAMGKSMLTAFTNPSTCPAMPSLMSNCRSRPAYTPMTACPRNSCWSASWICC
jgi:putative RecB family exonuclease